MLMKFFQNLFHREFMIYIYSNIFKVNSQMTGWDGKKKNLIWIYVFKLYQSTLTLKFVFNSILKANLMFN
jgi:hypothetical protein